MKKKTNKLKGLGHSPVWTHLHFVGLQPMLLLPVQWPNKIRRSKDGCLILSEHMVQARKLRLRHYSFISKQKLQSFLSSATDGGMRGYGEEPLLSEVKLWKILNLTRYFVEIRCKATQKRTGFVCHALFSETGETDYSNLLIFDAS